MTGSVILDVIIGLAFIYLLYSLFATIIQELIASQLGFRAKMLEKALVRMLEDAQPLPASAAQDRLVSIKNLFAKSQAASKGMSVVRAFYAHPLIKYLGEDKYFSKPSYINSANFSKVIVDLFRATRAVPGELATIGDAIKTGTITHVVEGEVIKINRETTIFLQTLWVDANEDLDKFRKLLEKWFDDTMERASGWYKKHIQLVLFCLGFLMAAIFNVDSIQLAKNLSRDPKLREQVLQSANAYMQRNQETKDQLMQMRAQGAAVATDSASAAALQAKTTLLVNKADTMLNNEIAQTNQQLGIGWHPQTVNNFFHLALKGLFGWLITALAISLGAPFWFDLLNKFMSLRGAGTKLTTVANTDQDTKTDPPLPPATVVVAPVEPAEE